MNPASIKKHHIYLANLNPQKGTESGKIRPVVVVQTDLLNTVHESTIICPITTNVQSDSEILRCNLNHPSNGLKKNSDIVVDQLRAIDNGRFIEHLGELTEDQIIDLKTSSQIILLED